ncbi:allatotropins [Nilaparvata lugens]|uniref:Allatotropin n=1 Tax=Nilaparvata lugens TaxID=108931 RepID=U3U421_NILLU|nr:allatotropins [Nilaparvata lugens]BAO00936.1 allatotropin [Nilaparvata lugens]
MRLYLWLAWSLWLVCGVLGGYQGGSSRGDRPRTIRGFKNGISLSTARGFGKRSGLADSEQWLFSADKESFPADWFADEMSKNPELAKVIVQKFIDSNQDGRLSSDELLRPLYSEN